MINQRKNFIRPDWLIITIYILLAGFGIGNILSSSISGEEIKLFEFNNLYSKQLVFFMVSLMFAFIVMTIEVKFYERFASIFYLISIVVLLGLFFFGKRVNGALSWYDLGGFNLQPKVLIFFCNKLKLGTSLL